MAKIGDRWAALEPLRQGARNIFGAFGKEMARGLRILDGAINGDPQMRRSEAAT